LYIHQRKERKGKNVIDIRVMKIDFWITFWKTWLICLDHCEKEEDRPNYLGMNANN